MFYIMMIIMMGGDMVVGFQAQADTILLLISLFFSAKKLFYLHMAELNFIKIPLYKKLWPSFNIIHILYYSLSRRNKNFLGARL